MCKFRLFVGLCTLMLVNAVGFEARADVVLTTSPGQVTQDGVVSFGSLGPEGTFVPNNTSMSVTGISGLTVKVDGNIDGGFLRVDQGSLWNGTGFPLPGQLLSTNPTSITFPPGYANTIDSGLSLDFSQSIGGFGGFFQLDPDRGAALGDPSFTVNIRATDVNHEEIIFDGSVVSTDGSPVFIGIRDNDGTTTPIRAIELSVTDSAGFEWDFAFDPIVQAAPGPGPAGGGVGGGGSGAGGGAQPVPEPSSLALCAVLGITGVVNQYRRRRQSR